MTKTEKFFKVLRIMLVIIAVGSFIMTVGFMGHIEHWDEESQVTVWDMVSAFAVFLGSVAVYKVVSVIERRIT